MLQPWQPWISAFCCGFEEAPVKSVMLFLMFDLLWKPLGSPVAAVQAMDCMRAFIHGTWHFGGLSALKFMYFTVKLHI